MGLYGDEAEDMRCIEGWKDIINVDQMLLVELVLPLYSTRKVIFSFLRDLFSLKNNNQNLDHPIVEKVKNIF